MQAWEASHKVYLSKQIKAHDSSDIDNEVIVILW